MDINFAYGFYHEGKLLYLDVDLNTSLKYYKELKKALKIKNVKNYPLVRIGQQNRDGGYIMVNNFQLGGIAYSFGINNDVSWDNAMANLGYNIQMYDHTINMLPYYIEGFYFHREGISGIDQEDAPLKTLKYYINKNGHNKAKNMILKMDVEGVEWDFLETVDSRLLKKFDQITFEYHGLIQTKYKNKIINQLKKLNKTHQLVHLHGNNSGYMLKIHDVIFPNVMEATYVNKDKYEFVENDEIYLPIDIDMPNDAARSDIILGAWNKSFNI